MVGEGDSLDEALNNLKVVINMYDKEFRSVYESIKKRFNTDYTPPTRAEIFNEMPADEHFNSDMFDSKEEQEEWRMNDLMLKPVAVDDSKVRKLEKAFENVSKENQKYLQLRELLNDILKDD
jgi:hypothetical protein